MANLARTAADRWEQIHGSGSRRARLGSEIGAERLGASLWVVPAGEAAYPFHFHLGEEELIVVLEGSGRLRAPDGWSELEVGDVVCFRPGEAGAHQIVAADTPLRFLAVSTAGAPDIVVYPDAGTLRASERKPGGIHELYRRQDAVGD